MSVLNQVQDDVKTAMKAGDRERVHALRLIVERAAEGGQGQRRRAEVAVLQRERKRRLEAAEAYRDGGRDDLAEAEEREAELIDAYLPEQISDEELRAIVGDAVAESGASSPQGDGQGHVAGDAAGARAAPTASGSARWSRRS